MTTTKSHDASHAAQQAAAAQAVAWTTEPPPMYANGAHVVHSVREFAVFFDDRVELPGRLARPDRPDEIRSRLVASLRMAPDAFFQTVCALAASWNRYAAAHLPPGTARFHLVDPAGAQLESVQRADKP